MVAGRADGAGGAGQLQLIAADSAPRAWAAALVLAVVARLAARRLGSLVRAAADPENLRAA